MSLKEDEWSPDTWQPKHDPDETARKYAQRQCNWLFDGFNKDNDIYFRIMQMNGYLNMENCIDCYAFLLFQHEVTECNDARYGLSWTQPSTRCYKCALLLN